MFWQVEPNHIVGKLTADMLEHCKAPPDDPERDLLFEDCLRVAARLLQGAPVDALESIVPEGSSREFEVLANAVRDAIEKNEPETGLDRLHTYVVKLIRTFAGPRGVSMDRDKALHSVFGEYVKRLRAAGLVESEMTVRILKSTISVFDSFNFVRNNKSLAHDNQILGYEESLLIFSHICHVIRFIRSIEKAVRAVRSGTGGTICGTSPDFTGLEPT